MCSQGKDVSINKKEKELLWKTKLSKNNSCEKKKSEPEEYKKMMSKHMIGLSRRINRMT